MTVLVLIVATVGYATWEALSQGPPFAVHEGRLRSFPVDDRDWIGLRVDTLHGERPGRFQLQLAQDLWILTVEWDGRTVALPCPAPGFWRVAMSQPLVAWDATGAWCEERASAGAPPGMGTPSGGNIPPAPGCSFTGILDFCLEEA